MSFYTHTDLDPARTQRLVTELLHGCDDGELYLQRGTSEAFSFDDGRLKSASFDTTQGFGLRGVSGEMTGYAHANELSEAPIGRAGATVALVRGGHASRRFDTVSERDFSGPIWSATFSWQPSGRLLLRASFNRDLSTVDDYDRIYAVSRVQRASFVYSLSSKLSAAVDLSVQRTDYRGDPRNLLTDILGQRPARADKSEEQRVSLAWRPRDRWQATLGYSLLSRRSNQTGLDFDARLTQMGVEYRTF